MARYTEAVCRYCRRDNTKLFLKGERCYTDKCAIDRRGYPPGQHGQLRRKFSDYGTQLREKQKVKRIYGILEKQFRIYFQTAFRKKGITGENLLFLLECRLDNVVYRLGLANSRAEARQLVRHTLKGEIEAGFSDPIFRSAMAAKLLYAGAPLDRLPSVSIIALVSELKDGMALPEGGMGKIPEALAYTLHQHGGEILLDARVKNIRVKNGQTCGVQTTERGFVEGDFVISTANAMATYQYLLDQPDQPKRLVQKAKRTPLSMSAFCVQLGVSNRIDATSHIHHIVPMMADLEQYIQPIRDMAEQGYYSIPTVIAPELAPSGGSIIEYVPVIRQNEPVEAWNDDRIDQLADASIEWLQSRHTMNITVKRIRSPREFQSQLNLYHGAIYGVSAAKGLTGLFPHKTPIEGLYLAGQTTFPGLGVPTAALSGIHAAKALIQNIK